MTDDSPTSLPAAGRGAPKGALALSDLDLALAAQAAYSGTPTWDTGLAHVYASVVNNVHVIAFRGSDSLEDWVQDFWALPQELVVAHQDLGEVHVGWLDDVMSVLASIEGFCKTAKGPVYLTGHSKGAAEALICTALLKAEGIDLAGCSTFGTPRPGHLAGLVAPGKDYQDRADVVCDVPSWLGRPRDLTHVSAPGDDPTEWHAISHYVAALQALTASRPNSTTPA